MNEKIKMSKVKTVLFVIGVWMTSFTIMWQMSEVVIVNNLYEAFPNGAAGVTAIMSWPAIFTALASLLAGAMLKKISSKFELIIAGVLMLFGIVAPMGNSLPFLTICSFLMAVGAGFANTAGMAIISEVFVDEKKRASNMGYYNAFMSLCGIAITFLAGIFALQGWQAAFRVNWIAIPMLIATIIFLPNIKPEDRPDESAAATDGMAETEKKGFGKNFWVFFISMFVFFMMYCCFFTYISVFIAENNLGDTAFTGTCSSLTTVGSMIASVTFGMLYPKLHRKLSWIYILIPMLAYLWAWMAPSKISAIGISLFYGFAYGGIYTLVYAYGSELVPASKNGMAMGLMTMNYSVAITIGTYIFSFAMSALGSIRAAYPIAMAGLGISLVMEIIATLAMAKRAKR